MKNPRPGDYMLSKTASTEGIASKKSLELKKRYLLGGDAAGSGALMKSDSTSVLDSKFRNFHSNISECQKLLNATTGTGTTKVPPQPSPLAKSETTIGVPAIVSTNNTVIKLSSKEFDSMKNSDEKENVYGKFVQNKNKLNATPVSEHNEVLNDAEVPLPQIILDLTVVSDKDVTSKAKDNKVSDQVSVETQLTKSTEVIDLVTPPVIQPLPTPITVESSDTKQRTPTEISRRIQPNKELYRRLDFKDDNESDEKIVAVIDLTADSPIKQSDSAEAQTAAERSKTTIDSMLKRVSGPTEMRKTKSLDEESVQPPRSPVHETCIQVPKIPWRNKSKAATDVESDSLSSSTTSSVDDIPHYILDSTTSPDTLPAGSDRFIPPRLEVRDTSGELMQIDSLMIIDGKYVGDPEDLKIMQMPLADAKTPTTETSPNDMPTVSVREPKVTFNTSTTICDSTTITATPTTTTSVSGAISPIPKPVYKYETIASKRPELRFDTRNENKIDTLKNIPLILPKRSASMDVPAATNLLQKSTTVIVVAKPTVLSLQKLSPTLEALDTDKTPTAATMSEFTISDSETEVTGQVLTETELSDWNADDAVSENFVDIEFVLNSNKGTIRRNKKSRKKQQSLVKQQIAKTEAPLARDLDFDGIEFMDTGSEDSCLETYSATNKALLKNRGYVKFVDTTAPNSKSLLSYKSDAGYGSSPKDSSERSPPKPTSLELHEAVNAEVSGIDYIEQGACILMSNNGINDLDMKTPMNEVPPIFNVRQAYTIDNHPPDSLNDMEEDSLLMIASQGTTTTEDSDALTIVTSPVDSSSPPKAASIFAGDTPSSDKNTISSGGDVGVGGSGGNMPNTSSSGTLTTTTTTAPSTGAGTETEMESSSGRAPTHKPPTLSSIDDRTTVMQPQSANRSSANNPTTADECSYSDYVRKLQMKITKISNARDSIDIRKTKRKHSKGDLSSCGSGGGSTGVLHPLSGVDCTEQPQQQIVATALASVIDSNKPLSIYVNNEMPATLTERIEEITKERTKQKDLIHDLVMDKLQSKKQLNAEKRLNRSRNRSMAMFSPPPVNAVTSGGTTPSADGFTMQSPHYHGIQNAVSPNYFTLKANTRNASPAASVTVVTATTTIKHKDLRPLSELINRGGHSEPPKIMKTQSFCVYSATPVGTGIKSDLMSKYGQDVNGYSTPVPPPRRNYFGDDPSLTQTERLRTEARARAKLKSNKDLGLSPDEKMLLLRKRFQLDAATPSPIANKSDDMKVRERKMISSKSVNDIAATSTSTSSVHDSVDRSDKKRSNYSDFTSDPNLADTNDDGGVAQKRRHKDPERRRSIIKAVSDFFYKRKDPSPAKEKSPSSSNEGMFGRFRISPKSKSKVSGNLFINISHFICHFGIFKNDNFIFMLIGI